MQRKRRKGRRCRGGEGTATWQRDQTGRKIPFETRPNLSLGSQPMAASEGHSIPQSKLWPGDPSSLSSRHSPRGPGRRLAWALARLPHEGSISLGDQETPQI